MNYVRATPAREAGRFVGFRLQPGREPGVLDELGLQPGDVVTTINGVQIDNPATGMKAMRELSDDQEISVTLLRDGEEISLNFRLPSSDQPK
jgi:general secretion pathway protein C